MTAGYGGIMELPWRQMVWAKIHGSKSRYHAWLPYVGPICKPNLACQMSRRYQRDYVPHRACRTCVRRVKA